MPILDRNSLEFISRSPEQTRRAGMRLGAMLRPGDVISLVGDLGSGKTVLVQGLANGWGSFTIQSPVRLLFWSTSTAGQMAVNCSTWMHIAC